MNATVVRQNVAAPSFKFFFSFQSFVDAGLPHESQALPVGPTEMFVKGRKL